MSPPARRRPLPLALGSLLLLAACARMAPPPGRPADQDPPRVELRSPAVGSTGLSGRPVFQLEFSEYVDRASVRSALSLNPRQEGELELSWRGRGLRIRPERPLPPDRTWTLELGTGVRDMAGNTLAHPLRVPFSSGATLDSLGFDLQMAAAGRPGLVQIWLWPLEQAPRRAYGTAPWRSSPDESGRVRFQGLPAGSWLALAVEDLNRDGWWDPRTERAGLPSRALAAPDPGGVGPLLLRLSSGLWTDSLSLQGGQFVDRERLDLRAWLEPGRLSDVPDSLREGWPADSLRLSELGLERADGTPVPISGLARRESGWRVFLAQPADSVEHVLRLTATGDSLRLRPPGGVRTESLVDRRQLASGWKQGRLRLPTATAARADASRVRQVLDGDTLSVDLRRPGADLWELLPRRPGGQLLLEKGLLAAGDESWPDTLLLLPVPADAPAAPGPRGGLQGRWDRQPRDAGWRLVVTSGDQERQLPLREELALDALPEGPATFALYLDRDGSGTWSPGRLRPLTPAEPWQALPDTVRILPGWVQGGLTFTLPEWIP
jgi:hypothetical protein